MAYKDINEGRAAIRRHYYANKEKYLEKNKENRKKLRAFVNSVKESQPCADCGHTYPYYVMDFDHLHSKEMLISRLVLLNNKAALQKEIEKCEVVCANCHRKRTFARAAHIQPR